MKKNELDLETRINSWTSHSFIQQVFNLQDPLLGPEHTGHKMHSPDAPEPEFQLETDTTQLISVRHLIIRFNHIKLPFLQIEKANTDVL